MLLSLLFAGLTATIVLAGDAAVPKATVFTTVSGYVRGPLVPTVSKVIHKQQYSVLQGPMEPSVFFHPDTFRFVSHSVPQPQTVQQQQVYYIAQPVSVVSPSRRFVEVLPYPTPAVAPTPVVSPFSVDSASVVGPVQFLLRSASGPVLFQQVPHFSGVQSSGVVSVVQPVRSDHESVAVAGQEVTDPVVVKTVRPVVVEGGSSSSSPVVHVSPPVVAEVPTSSSSTSPVGSTVVASSVTSSSEEQQQPQVSEFKSGLVPKQN